jgi:hypothetical protein
VTWSNDTLKSLKACEVVRWAGGLLNLTFIIGTFAGAARAQGEPAVRPWWVGMELGEAQVQLNSDQVTRPRAATFELGFVGGHSLGDRMRAGVEVNGWFLQASNLNDPTVGEGVSNVLGILDAFPSRKKPFFLRGGAGYSSYANNRPGEFGSSGWLWTAGTGYEFHLRDAFGLAPMVAYSAGHLGDVRNPVLTDTGRRFSAIEFKVDLLWHFGRPK